MRQRLRLAVWVAFAGYATIFAWRLIVRPPSDSELLTLAEIVSSFGALWLVLWVVGRRRERRRW